MNRHEIYAESLFSLAEEAGKTGSILNELIIAAGCMRDNPLYIRLLDAANIAASEKACLIDNALRAFHPYIRNMLKLLAERRQAALFQDCIQKYQSIYEAAQGTARARVALPFHPDKQTLERIQAKLAEISGKMVQIQLSVDPGLIGGMMIELDGRHFDNSIRTKLRRIYAQMAGTMAEE